MKWLLNAWIGLFFLNTAYAGESGYVFQGKRYVVYRDGIKVGKTFEEEFKDPKRTPSSIPAGGEMMAWEQDEIARCYRFQGGTSSDNTKALSCVKLK